MLSFLYENKILWIYCFLINLNNFFGFVCAEEYGYDSDLPISSLDFLENDQSVIPLQSKNDKRYLQYEVTSNRDEESNENIPADVNNQGDIALEQRTGNSNSTLNSRFNLGFLLGNSKGFELNFGGRPTRRIPATSNDRKNEFASQVVPGNQFLWSQNNEIPTQRSTTTTRKRPNNKVSQWGSQENSGFNPQSAGFQIPNFQPSNNWEQSNIQSQSTRGKPNSFGTQSSQSVNNNNKNNWQQNGNSNKRPSIGSVESNDHDFSNEDNPSWGSQTQSWTSKKPINSGNNWQQTTSQRPSNWWETNVDDKPLWTQKTTSPGRYKPSTTKRPHRKTVSELKCEEYAQPYTQTINALPLSLDPELLSIKVGKCDRNAQALIVGGQRSELGEFPHMVAVGFRTRRGITWNCGGSLVSEYFVLTAAHCTDSSLGKPVAVRLGELNLVRNDDGASPENYKVVQVITHPEYRSSKKYNDIALLKLERAVKFNNYVRPACLNTQQSVGVNKAIATGWGSIGFGDRSSEVLLKVGLSLIDNRQCANLYSSEQSVSLENGIVSSQLCAGELQGGKDTCLGDSGGPLQVTSDTNKCIYKIVGITSFGKFCGEKNSPGVYTRVSAYISWIEGVVWP